MKEIVDYAKTIVLEAGDILRNTLGKKTGCSYKNNDHQELLTEYDRIVVMVSSSHLLLYRYLLDRYHMSALLWPHSKPAAALLWGFS